jgi:hypothetical protein
MPSGGFKWDNPTLDGLNDFTDKSPIGRMYEVDIVYPQHLHDKHKDLPFHQTIVYQRAQKCKN